MAKFLQSAICHSPIAVAPPSSSSSPPPHVAAFTSAAWGTRVSFRHYFPSELSASSIRRASIPRAHTQLQDRSSTTPHEGIKWWERELGATLADVHSVEELINIVTDVKGKLVIVEFFAPWCGSCRALYPKLCKLAREHQDIVFVKVNFDENKEFCKTLNIKVLPYFHLYRGELEQLDSFSCSITKLQKLKDAIAKYGVNEHFTHGRGSEVA